MTVAGETYDVSSNKKETCRLLRTILKIPETVDDEETEVRVSKLSSEHLAMILYESCQHIINLEQQCRALTAQNTAHKERCAQLITANDELRRDLENVEQQTQGFQIGKRFN